jgi:hypothetical protein
MPASKEQSTKLRGEGKLAPALTFALILVGVVVAGALAGGGWVVFKGGDRSWLGAAVRSPLFVTCGLITLGCAVVLAVIARVLWRAGTVQRLRRRDQEGAVILEFAMVLPFALFLVLLMTQSSMLMGGNLCVHYAAYSAARSAIVQVPTNANADEPPNVMLDAAISAKYQRIRMAAVWALLPVSCGSEEYPDTGIASTLVDGLDRFFSLYNAPRPGWLDQATLGRKLAYASDDHYTTVELEPPANGVKYGEHEDIRVNVTHTLYLSVPYANWLFASLDSRDGVRLDFGTSNYGMRIRASCTLTNEGLQDFVEPETFPQ